MSKNGVKRDIKLGLRLIGLSWLFCLSFIAFYLWMFSDEAGVPIVYAKFVLSLGLGILCVSFLFSFVAPPQLSRVVFSCWIGGFGLLSIVLLASFFGVSFFVIGINNFLASITWIVVLCGVCGTWSWYRIQGLKQRIQQRRFIEKEFRIEETQIVMRSPPKTDLDPPPIQHGSWQSKVGSWLFPKLVFLIPMAYPLQRLFSNAGGFPAAMLLLSIFSLPLAIYFIGRMACGYYLWIHTVRKLEKQHGKPVVFEH